MTRKAGACPAGVRLQNVPREIQPVSGQLNWKQVTDSQMNMHFADFQVCPVYHV